MELIIIILLIIFIITLILAILSIVISTKYINYINHLIFYRDPNGEKFRLLKPHFKIIQYKEKDDISTQIRNELIKNNPLYPEFPLTVTYFEDN